jgi:hypothetical protein
VRRPEVGGPKMQARRSREQHRINAPFSHPISYAGTRRMLSLVSHFEVAQMSVGWLLGQKYRQVGPLVEPALLHWTDASEYI